MHLKPTREFSAVLGSRMIRTFRESCGLGLSDDHRLATLVAFLLLGEQSEKALTIEEAAMEALAGVSQFIEDAAYHRDDRVSSQVGANFSGRLAEIRDAAQARDYARARRELLALLKFFPPSVCEPVPAPTPPSRSVRACRARRVSRARRRTDGSRSRA